MSTLHADAYRDTDGTWTVKIPELTSTSPSGATIVATGSAVSFRGIDKAARELAAVWLDVSLNEVDVSVSIQAPDGVTALWQAGGRAEAEGRARLERGAALRREAVRKLRADGYTVEAAAALLGVSYQRVQQLANG